MAVHLSGVFFSKPSISAPVFQHQRRLPLTLVAAASAAPPPSSPPTIQIVGGKSASWYGNSDMNSSNSIVSFEDEYDWADLETDLYHWTKPLRPVQWYPGHIAKTERELKEQLKLMDVVIEVRDGRIPMSTSHPLMDSWLGNRKRILVLNREDMISAADRNAWADYYGRQGIKVVFSNGQLGMGTMKLGRLAKSVAAGVNMKRRARGLLPRPVRAGIVGYPNVGKSSLINRLLKRRMCPAAPRPGVTRTLKWVRFGSDLELLDSPGIIPMRMSDQAAAIKLAICDDIGEKSYDFTDVAGVLVQMLSKLPEANNNALWERYKIDTDGRCGKTTGHDMTKQVNCVWPILDYESMTDCDCVNGTTIGDGFTLDILSVQKTFVHKLAIELFNGDEHQAAFRILSDFRKGRLGKIALERPPVQPRVT